MPKQFIFRGNESHFNCILEKERCVGLTKSGGRCNRESIIGFEYCYQHLLLDKHLRIKKSTLHHAGMGLFAMDKTKDANAIIFRIGATIVEYKGDLTTQLSIDNLYGNATAPYAVKVSNNVIIDCACRRGVGSLANTYPNHNNAALSAYHGRARIKATKNIRNNQEIFCSYGNSYKLQEQGVSHKTTNIF